MSWKLDLGVLGALALGGYFLYVNADKVGAWLGGAFSQFSSSIFGPQAAGSQLTKNPVIATGVNVVSAIPGAQELAGGINAVESGLAKLVNAQPTVPVSVLPSGSITVGGKTYYPSDPGTVTVSHPLVGITDEALAGAQVVANIYGSQIDPYAQVGSPVWILQHGGSAQ